MASRLRSPSAALVFGVLAGLLIMSVFVSMLPLAAVQAMRNQEHMLSYRLRATAVGLLLNKDSSKVAVDFAVFEGDRLVDKSDSYNEEFRGLCGRKQRLKASGEIWLVVCEHHENKQAIVAARLHPFTAANQTIMSFLLMGLVGGIVAALLILRLLRPLADISASVSAIELGCRPPDLPRTGLLELDTLMDGINQLAITVADREDAIIGRLEASAQMARMVAHEVRNPLQSLELLTTLLSTEEDAEERMELAAAIHSEIRNLDDTVSRLLLDSSSRSSSLHLKLTQQTITNMLKQIVTVLGPKSNAQNVTLRVRGVDHSLVDVDTALMRRAVENLVLNAIQATENTGSTIELSASAVDNYLSIAVEDDGPGVPKEFGTKVFEMNFTTKSSGSGLGLAMVKGVATAHGGFVQFGESSLGGARFEICIPISSIPSDEQNNEKSTSR